MWLRNDSAANRAQLFFRTESSPAFSGNKRFNFEIKPNDPVGRVYHLNMGSNPNWTGSLKGLCLDPAQGVSSGAFEVDYVKVHAEAEPVNHTAWTDDSDGTLAFTGNWALQTGDPADHERTSQWSNTTGDFVEYPFYGTSITVAGRIGPDQGIGRALIDGAVIDDFDAYAD